MQNISSYADSRKKKSADAQIFLMEHRGDRLKRFAKQCHGGVGKLAELIGVHPTTMSRYTTNSSQPTADVMEKLAVVARLNLRWYLTGEGEMEVPESKPRSGRIVTPEEKGPSGRFVGTVEILDRRYGLTPLDEEQGADEETEENGEPEETEED